MKLKSLDVSKAGVCCLDGVQINSSIIKRETTGPDCFHVYSVQLCCHCLSNVHSSNCVKCQLRLPRIDRKHCKICYPIQNNGCHRQAGRHFLLLHSYNMARGHNFGFMLSAQFFGGRQVVHVRSA
jgi:hypothetical protein